MKKILIIPILIISILSFNKVQALEGEAQYHNLFFDNARLPYVGASPVYHYFELYNSTSTTLLNTKQLQWGDSTPSSTNMMGGYDFVEFSFIVLGTMQPNVGQTAGVIDFDNSEYCTEWTPKTGGGYTCVRVTQGENFQNTLMDYEFRNIVLNMKASVINAANLATECEVDLAKQKITCPLWAVNRVGFNQIRLQYSMNGRGSAGVYLAISRTIFLYNDSSSVISGQINQQTQQQQTQYNNFMNETQQYDKQIDTNQTGANETIEYMQREEQLLNSLDMNTSIMDNIYINPQASAFIWDIAEVLRGMNPAIVVLFTSILGLGIAKLILNR